MGVEPPATRRVSASCQRASTPLLVRGTTVLPLGERANTVVPPHNHQNSRRSVRRPRPCAGSQGSYVFCSMTSTTPIQCCVQLHKYESTKPMSSTFWDAFKLRRPFTYTTLMGRKDNRLSSSFFDTCFNRWMRKESENNDLFRRCVATKGYSFPVLWAIYPGEVLNDLFTAWAEVEFFGFQHQRGDKLSYFSRNSFGGNGTFSKGFRPCSRSRTI